jgi:RNA polymerase sigma factor for flagellar operon FliA
MSAARSKTPQAMTRADYERYLPLVRRISMKLVRRMPREVSIDDLIGAGWLGLVEAIGRRTPTMTEDEFAAYASHRVRGAILDHLRALDPMSRKMRGASRKIADTIKTLSARLGRSPDEMEIADDLGLPLDDYHELLGDVSRADCARLDIADVSPPDTNEGPELAFGRREIVDRIASAVDALPERLRLVLGLHYQEDASLREIGEVLGVTESRACQLHSEAVHRIRAQMEIEDESGPASVSRLRGLR